MYTTGNMLTIGGYNCLKNEKVGYNDDK